MAHMPRISTHAPRVGSDAYWQTCLSWQIYFNPRSPRGERPGIPRTSKKAGIFQPTLPAWGATRVMMDVTLYQLFQPTLPAWGATGSSMTDATYNENFNPRSPRGERREHMIAPPMTSLFQPTLPAWGATGKRTIKRVVFRISTHAPRVGSDFHYLSLPLL